MTQSNDTYPRPVKMTWWQKTWIRARLSFAQKAISRHKKRTEFLRTKCIKRGESLVNYRDKVMRELTNIAMKTFPVGTPPSELNGIGILFNQETGEASIVRETNLPKGLQQIPNEQKGISNLNSLLETIADALCDDDTCPKHGKDQRVESKTVH